MKSASRKTNPSALDFAQLCRCLDDEAVCVRAATAFPEHLALDTRNIVSNSAFFALQGSHVDGRDFISAAINVGANWIVTDQRPPDRILSSGDVGVIQTPNPRLLLAKLAAEWYVPQPGQQVLVTGTNGKSSVAEYFRQLGMLLHSPVVSIGTLGVRGLSPQNAENGKTDTPVLTSPDSLVLHRLMSAAAVQGIDVVALEASSHGLHQQRLAGTRPSVAIFTGLGRDHLDYHCTLDEYLAAKMLLFDTLLPPDGTAIYADQSQGSSEVRRICRRRGIAHYGYATADADFALDNVVCDSKGMQFIVGYGGRKLSGMLPLFGRFQLDNALAAAAAWVSLGADFNQIIQAMSLLRPVDGRLEHIGCNAHDAMILVDYAHTPDAILRLLHDTRPHVRGQLWLVFGCGGDRDAGKRTKMGAIAQQYADQVIVTDDNPRSEDPVVIRAAVLSVCPKAREIADRHQAIAYAIARAQSGDAVIVAGKGHESVQIVAGQVLPFDDRAVVQQLLKTS